MKKKLAAILSVCLVLSTALFSCGDSDDDDNSSRKKNSSSSASDPKYDQNDDDEDEDEEATTEDITTTEEATEEITTAAADPKPSSGGSSGSFEPYEVTVLPVSEAPSPAGGDIIGKWGPIAADQGMEAMLEFGSNGKGSMYVDISSTMHFTSDRALYMDGLSMGKDSVSFDGTYIRVKMDTETFGIDPSELDEETAALFTSDILVLKRKGAADSSTLDGAYSLEGGLFSDTLTEAIVESSNGISATDILVNIDGENMNMELDDIFSYTTSGSDLTLDSSSALLSEELENTTIKYHIENNKLYLYNEDEVMVLNRASK